MVDLAEKKEITGTHICCTFTHRAFSTGYFDSPINIQYLLFLLVFVDLTQHKCMYSIYNIHADQITVRINIRWFT